MHGFSGGAGHSTCSRAAEMTIGIGAKQIPQGPLHGGGGECANKEALRRSEDVGIASRVAGGGCEGLLERVPDAVGDRLIVAEADADCERLMVLDDVGDRLLEGDEDADRKWLLVLDEVGDQLLEAGRDSDCKRLLVYDDTVDLLLVDDGDEDREKLLALGSDDVGDQLRDED